jgi:hypothetical protein
VARVLYLAYLLTQDGFQLKGHQLVEHLSASHEVQVAGMVVADDDPLLSGPFADSLVRESRLEGFDAIVMEGGWRPWGADLARISLDQALKFVRAGGQLLVCDIDRNEARKYRDDLVAAQRLLKAIPKYNSDLGVEYLHDDLAQDPDRYGFWFYPSEMLVNDWLRPALDGVDRLLVCHPLSLLPGDAIAASGASTTEVLASDIFVNRGLRAPWASMSSIGHGHVLAVGGIVTPDPMIERSPGNAIWLGNLLNLTLERTSKRMGWTKPVVSPADDLHALAAAPESQTLERKSSFLASVDLAQPDVPEKAIQKGVGKSIVALANTDGGHIFIGIADDGTAVGLDADFERLRGDDKRDLFEQRLARYIHQNIEPSSTLGLKQEWLTVDGKDVLAITVPKAHDAVYLVENNDDVVYVRTMTTTNTLRGRALTDWLRGPRWSTKR